jgi:hypothetical protein
VQSLFLVKKITTRWLKKTRTTLAKKISFTPPKGFLCEKLTKII